MEQALELVFVKSVDAKGKVSYETRRHKNIKATALPEDVEAVAQAILTVAFGEHVRTMIAVTSELSAQ